MAAAAIRSFSTAAAPALTSNWGSSRRCSTATTPPCTRRSRPAVLTASRSRLTVACETPRAELSSSSRAEPRASTRATSRCRRRSPRSGRTEAASDSCRKRCDMIRYYHDRARSSRSMNAAGHDPRDRNHDPLADVRERFLAAGKPYGCAESTLLALEDHFGLDDPANGAAAMALNGGVAYSGGTCGALTGAALALGQLAARRIDDRRTAKRVARELTADVVEAFRAAFGATDCRTLTGIDLRAPGAHAAFIAGGTWRIDCLRRLELV